MTKEQITAILERVQTWPEERLKDVAVILLEMEAQDTSPYQLSDEELAEVRRRRSKPNPKYVSLTQSRTRLSHLGI